MFSLIWHSVAQRLFASLWKKADAKQRQEIARALQRIILTLSTVADQAGESRDRGRRVIHEPPLGMYCRVDLNRMRVKILSVWVY